MTLRNKTIWYVIWSAIEAGGVTGLQLITLVVMARLIGPTEFGLAALAYSVMMLLGLLITGLFNDAIVQRRDLEKAHLDSAFWAALFISMVIVAGCWLGSPQLATFFKEPKVAPVLAWMSLALLPQGLSCVPVAKFRRDLNFKAVALRQLIGNLVGMTVGITMAFYGFGVWSLVAQRLASSSVSTLFVWVSSPYRPRWAYSWHHLWELLRFGLPIVGSNFVHAGYQRIFALLISFFFGTTVLGFVNIAFRIVYSLRTILSSTLYNVALPMFSRRQDDQESLRRGLLQAVEFTSLITLPLFAGLSVCAFELVFMLLGEQWLPAVPLVQILAVVVILPATIQLFGMAITAIGKPHINLLTMSFGLLISITLMLTFGRGDVIIATIAWSANPVIMWPVVLFITQHVVGISLRDQAAAFIGPLTAAALMSLALVGVKALLMADSNALTTMLVIVPLGITLYGGLLTLMRPRLIPSFSRFILGAFTKERAAATE